jgi:AbrB family looped-hinge helix DNA binding protein
MATLTVTSKGQVTLRKDVLRHLGVKPGDKIDVDLLPDGALTVRAAEPAKSESLEDFFGMLSSKNGPVLTLDEISEAIEDGWSSAMDYEKEHAVQDSALDDTFQVRRRHHRFIAVDLI